MSDLSVTIAGVRLPNPVMPASGTYDYSERHDNFFSPAELGAVVNKTIFLNHKPGNKPPRVYEAPCGMLNAIGIPTAGVKDFIENTLPLMRGYGVPVIVSIAGNTSEEFCKLAEIITETGKADMLELNLSCPNLNEGVEWARDKKLLYDIVKLISESTTLPVIAKLSPMVTDIAEMGLIAEEAGASALAVFNTYRGMVIDINTMKPVLGNIAGGLSGPAIHPLAVYSVYSTYKRVSIPIIGMGGIASWKDAVEFILAGATAVAVGMYNFVNPMIMIEVIEGMSRYLHEKGISNIRDIVGKAHR
ncbi:MAG: dihydroorotate dehydrogenase [Spirochaetes bacterium]|nr:MAG: dihydroorotate dehydrogenase [Spirochaetota bacterium]